MTDREKALRVASSGEWEEFFATLERLIDLEGCDNTHGAALRVLRDMKLSSDQVEAILAFCKEHGGCCCSCEIILNTTTYVEE